MSLVLGEFGELVGETLVAVPLTYYWCQQLGPKVTEEDKVDCVAHGGDPTQALLTGMEAGPSCAILDRETRQVMGACGWTYEGNIWSLWSDLTSTQMREIMRHTKPAVAYMHRQALARGLILSNVVWEGNRRAITWLRASKCFDFADQDILHGGLRFIPFFVKPLEALLDV